MSTDRHDDMNELVVLTIAEVAPDLDPSTLSLDDDLRDELELDSMDLRSLAAALAARTEVEIADADLARMTLVRDVVDHLLAQPHRD